MSYQYARRAMLALAALVLTAWVQAAWGFPATVIEMVHLRAGPSVFYPSVALLGRGTTVTVFGCEVGWGWCDAAAGMQRGWIAADYLLAQGPAGPVVIAGNGLTLGLTVTPFVFNTYWGMHYRTMPWYARRTHYFNYWNRFPHGRPPPPPRFRPRPPVRPPPVMRPPPRPPPASRPPPGTRPPPGSGRPPAGGQPPASGRPPSSGRPPPASTSPATTPSRPDAQPR